MNFKHVKTSLLFLLALFSFSAVQAQSSLRINFKEGELQEFSLDALRSITLDEAYENISVSLESKQTYSFALESIRSFLFTDMGTAVPAVQTPAGFDLVVYPNPVRDILNLQLPETVEVKGTVTLYNNRGQLVQQVVVNKSAAISMDVSSLPQGVYLCRYSSDGVVRTVKFIKH